MPPSPRTPLLRAREILVAAAPVPTVPTVPTVPAVPSIDVVPGWKVTADAVVTGPVKPCPMMPTVSVPAVVSTVPALDNRHSAQDFGPCSQNLLHNLDS